MDIPASEIKLFAHDTGTLLHARWRRLLTQGLVMIMLGTLAMALPVMTTLAVDVIVGWLLLIGGAWLTIAHLRANYSHAFGWYLVISAMAGAAGAMMLMAPLAGIRMLTGFLCVFFVLEGASKIAFAFDLRAHAHEWGWALMTGVVDLMLATLIIAGWPGMAAWAIGLLVGLNMLIFGIALIVISLAARRARDLDLRKIVMADRYVPKKNFSPAR